MTCRVVVLISGNGSNLQAIMERATTADAGYKVVQVLSDQADAYGLARARKFNIPATAVNHHDDRDAFEAKLITHIDSAKPDLIALAGFMHILSPSFVTRYHGRLINIHPSLLPEYRGLNTHQRAIADGKKVHGTTVHFVTEELDSGPIIASSKVPIEPNDTVENLTARVKAAEHKLYPAVIQQFATGQLTMRDGELLHRGSTKAWSAARAEGGV